MLLLAGMIDALSPQIRTIEIELLAWHRANAICRRLETIPGIGFITATALAATVGDAKVFRSRRQFAAWFGLVPKQHSSGGKERMGGISKMVDRYLRHLLVVGTTAFIRYTRRRGSDPPTPSWPAHFAPREHAGHINEPDQANIRPLAWGAS